MVKCFDLKGVSEQFLVSEADSYLPVIALTLNPNARCCTSSRNPDHSLCSITRESLSGAACADYISMAFGLSYLKSMLMWSIVVSKRSLNLWGYLSLALSKC